MSLLPLFSCHWRWRARGIVKGLLNLRQSTNGLIGCSLQHCTFAMLWYVTMHKSIIVLRAKHPGSLGRVKPEQCTRDLKDLGVRRKGALRPAPHYRSCQPSSTDMRGPTVAWGFYLELVSAAWRWLILYSYHSAPWETQLLFPCHHADSVAAALQLLPNESSLRQGLSLVLRPGGSWGWGSVAPRAAGSRGLLCLCSVWRCSPHCGMQCWACWMRGLPKGRGGKGERKREGGGWVRGDLWTVPSGSYDSIFNRGS